jgi:tetratricopeptide (TPR) repeat protein
MKKTFDPTQVLILIALFMLILAPRPLLGFLDMRSADRYEAAGNHAAATQAFASAAARLPWIPTLWEQAGENAIQDGNFGSAIAFLTHLAGHRELTKQGWLSLGLAYQQQGDQAQAVDAWEQALPLPLASSQLANAQRGMGDFSKAIEYWHTALAQEPGNAAARYSIGLLLAATAPEMALPELMQALELDPGLDPQVQSMRTALNTGLLSDDRPYQFLVSGRALGWLGEWDLAVEAFQNAIAVRPGYAEAWAWLGEAEQQQGKDGRQAIDQALALNPEIAMVQGLYGMYVQRQGQPGAALAAFQKAAALEPGDPVWQMALGAASEKTGDLVTAYEHFFLAVEMAPKDASTWRALVVFCISNDVDVEQVGLPAARKLIGLAPTDWQSYDLAGQAEFLLEQYNAAETYFNKAVELNPTQSDPALHLGLVLLQTGNFTSAYSYLNQAWTLDQNGPVGWQAKRLLEQNFP